MLLQRLRCEDRAEPYLVIFRHKKAANSLRKPIFSWLRGLDVYDFLLRYWPTSLLNNEWLRGLDVYDFVLRYRPTSLLNNEWLPALAATFTELP